MQEPIGLLGGSFDPIHRGHLQLARDALMHLQLAEVRFIPAAQPWQKGAVSDAAVRAHLVGLALAAEAPDVRARFVLDMHEIERGGPSYTIDTLRALRAALGADVPLVLIIGSDQMQRFDTWREWQQIPDFAHIAVARRNDAILTMSWELQDFYNSRWRPPGQLRTQPAGLLFEVPMTPVDASATAIRALLKAPRTAAGDARLASVVPAPVLDYIRARKVYA
jgi:nicotinate-nucleotide adenylyltransferase